MTVGAGLPAVHGEPRSGGRIRISGVSSLAREETRPYLHRETDLDADLHDLLARGLLHHDHKTNRFNLHPIVRRYAYDRLEGGDRAAAHHRLRDYFAAMPPPEQVRTLDDLAPVIELYYHTVAAGQYDEARTLFRDRLAEPLYFQLGSSQLIIELLRSLFPDGEDRLPRLKEERAQAWTLNELANSYGFSGQPARAVSVFQADTDLTEKLGEKTNIAIGLGNLAIQQIAIGALAAAEANLRRRIALCRESGTSTGRRSATRSWAGCRPTGARGRSRRSILRQHGDGGNRTMTMWAWARSKRAAASRLCSVIGSRTREKPP